MIGVVVRRGLVYLGALVAIATAHQAWWHHALRKRLAAEHESQSAALSARLIEASSAILAAHAEAARVLTRAHERIEHHLAQDPPGDPDPSTLLALVRDVIPPEDRLDVALVDDDFRIRATTNPDEAGLDLGAFPDAVAAFQSLTNQRRHISGPQVDSAGVLRVFCASRIETRGLFLQTAFWSHSFHHAIAMIRSTTGSAAPEADVLILARSGPSGGWTAMSLTGAPVFLSTTDLAAAADAPRFEARIETAGRSFAFHTAHAPESASKTWQLDGVETRILLQVAIDTTLDEQLLSSSRKWSAVLLGASLLLGFTVMGAVIRNHVMPLRQLAHHVASATPMDVPAFARGIREWGTVARAHNEQIAKSRAERDSLRDRLRDDVVAEVEAAQRRIGADIHDGLGQHLAGIEMMSWALAARAQEGDCPGSPELAHLAQLLRDCQEEARRISRGLQPVADEPAGLRVAIETLAVETAERTGVRVDVAWPAAPPPMKVVASNHVFRIVQEAVANAIRHGHPSRVAIGMEPRGDALLLSIENDGLPPDPSALDTQKGQGLLTMRYRASMLGGKLGISPGPSGGARIEVLIPVPDARQEPA